MRSGLPRWIRLVQCHSVELIVVSWSCELPNFENLVVSTSSFLMTRSALLAYAGDALNALRQSLIDSSNVLQSWDPTLVNPCSWFHVTCNAENSVTRVYVHFVLRLFAAIVTFTAFYLLHSLTGLNSHVSLHVSTWRTCIA